MWLFNHRANFLYGAVLGTTWAQLLRWYLGWAGLSLLGLAMHFHLKNKEMLSGGRQT